jgi:hypothetical protein
MKCDKLYHAFHMGIYVRAQPLTAKQAALEAAFSFPPLMTQPTPFDITTAENGMRVASNGAMRVALHDTEGVIFRRRGMQVVGPEAGATVEWAVVELAGVRVYVDSASGAVVVSRQDIRP